MFYAGELVSTLNIGSLAPSAVKKPTVQTVKIIQLARNSITDEIENAIQHHLRIILYLLTELH